MELDVSELLKNKITELTFKQVLEQDYLERDGYRLSFKSPLVINGRAVHNSDIIELEGNISVVIEAECSRCLEECEFAANVDYTESFSKSIDDEEVYPIVEGKIILDDMTMDNLILSMPVRLLCKEECKGLCPNCGVNLNKVDCDCEKEAINPKFAALKDLFKQS